MHGLRESQLCFIMTVCGEYLIMLRKGINIRQKKRFVAIYYSQVLVLITTYLELREKGELAFEILFLLRA